MLKLRPALLAMLLSACPVLAKADTLDFTVIVTQQEGITAVPVGTVYTGTAHYAGVWDLNSIGYPPVIDAFTFTYPSTPASLAGYFLITPQRFRNGDPLYLLVTYLDPSSPTASFSIIGSTFALFTPNAITANGYSASAAESGTVTYTLVPDQVATTPEPASVGLLGTGVLCAWNFVRRRRAAE